MLTKDLKKLRRGLRYIFVSPCPTSVGDARALASRLFYNNRQGIWSHHLTFCIVFVFSTDCGFALFHVLINGLAPFS